MHSSYLFVLFICLVFGVLHVLAADGVCGSANGKSLVDVPENSTLCADNFKFSVPTSIGPDFKWLCYRNGTGVDAVCWAKRTVTLPGLCGYARHQNLTNKALLTSSNANYDVCLHGAPSEVFLFQNSQFQWTCAGTGAGTSMTCTANYTPYSCDGNGNGAKFSKTVVENVDVSNLCPYGNGNYSVRRTKTINLTCTGSEATVTSEAITSEVQSGVCAAYPGSPNLSFLGDWKTQKYGGFNSIQRVSNWSLYTSSEFSTFRGQGVAKVVVNPGDDPINSSGERSEVLVPYHVNPRYSLWENSTTGTQFFAFTYKFPTDYNVSNYGGKWGIVVQLHGPDAYALSPSVEISAAVLQAGGSLGYKLVGTSGFLPNGTRGSLPGYVYSSNDPEPMYLNRWVEFIVQVTFSIYQNGSAIMYKRNEGEKTFRLAASATNCATLQTYEGYPVGNHYWKQGLYRNKGDNNTATLYMGPFVRATTFEDVEMAAFGTNYGTKSYPADPGDTFLSTTTGGSSTATATTGSSTGTGSQTTVAPSSTSTTNANDSSAAGLVTFSLVSVVTLFICINVL